MPAFDILARALRLGAANLTLREQVRLAENPLDLRWPALAPRVPTNSLKIRDITTAPLRLTAEYRAWNANGPELFSAVGPISEWEILPLTAQKHFDEKRNIELQLPDPSIRALVDNGIVGDVDTWSERIADAVHRRLEVGIFQHWLTNTFTCLDPHTGTVVTAPLGFSASRYVTEGAAWTGGTGGTAYPRFKFHAQEAARQFGGPGSVARMRDATFQLIVSSAPVGANNARPTVSNLTDRLQEDGITTVPLVDQRTYDKRTDAGTGTTPTFYVPTGKVGFQPADGRIGSTPSVAASRAGKEVTGDKRVDLRDVTIWHTQLNRGMSLLLEGENIAVPMPEEARVYVVDALV